MISDLVAAVEACMADGRPISEQIREAETGAGYAVIPPGLTPGFHELDRESVISFARCDDLGFLRLVLLVMKRPGTGGFSRLCAHLRAINLIPLVICPTEQFAQMLQRRGWVELSVGDDFADRETWFVPRGHVTDARRLANHRELPIRRVAP